MDSRQDGATVDLDAARGGGLDGEELGHKVAGVKYCYFLPKRNIHPALATTRSDRTGAQAVGLAIGKQVFNPQHGMALFSGKGKTQVTTQHPNPERGPGVPKETRA